MNERPILDPTRAQRVNLLEAVQYSPNGIVSRTLMQTGTIRQVLFGFDAGQQLTEHTTTRHALIQVLDGECVFTVNSVEQVLRVGDLLHMPPHTPHAVQAGTRFAMLLTLFNTTET